MKTIAAIFFSDLHIRPTKPQARLDNFIENQFDILKQILKIQASFPHHPPLICAGDFGDKPDEKNWKTWLLNKTIKIINRYKSGGIHIIPGQHDLPDHRLGALNNKSGLAIIAAATGIKIYNRYIYYTDFNMGQKAIIFHFFPWGVRFRRPIEKFCDNGLYRNIAIMHRAVVNGNSVFDGWGAKDIYEKYGKYYDLIVCGDNHEPFRYKNILNCGSAGRFKIDQKNHRPAVYLWNAEHNKIYTKYLDCSNDIFNDKIQDKKEEEKERNKLFSEKLDSDFKIGTEFKKNMKRYVMANKITKKNIIKKLERCLK